MTFDETIIPTHNTVSSEWERNEAIRSAYGYARAMIIPNLIDLIEEHFGLGVWVKDTDLFHNQSLSELWAKPDYLAMDSTNKEYESKATNLHNTHTQLFFGVQKKQNGSSNGKKKLSKDFPDKCLLRHKFSGEKYWLMVGKLRRRHQKEIVKLPSLSALSSEAHSACAVLDAMVRSCVLKLYNQSSTNYDENFDEIHKDAERKMKESEIDEDKSISKEQLPQLEVLQKAASSIVVDGLSIVRAAENLVIGEVPKTSVVRWRAEEEFEIRYFK